MNLLEWMQRTGEVRRLRRQHDEADQRERELRELEAEGDESAEEA